MIIVLPLLVFLSLLLPTVMAYQSARHRSAARLLLAQRLERPQPAPRGDGGSPPSLLQEKAYSDIPRLNRLLGRLSLTEPLNRLVAQAGFHIRAGEAMLWMVFLGMTSSLLVLVWKGSLLGTVATFVVCGPGGGVWWLRHRRNARRLAILAQLPDTVDMIRGALQAGYSFPQALESVCDEALDPMRAEIRQVTEELRLGRPMRAAFEGLYERTGVSDLRFLIVGVLLNRDTGSSLSEILDVVANTVRERFKLKAQVRALTAQGRFSALVLFLLAPALFLALSWLNPGYLEPLYHTRPGKFALGYGAASAAFGYFLMRRIVDIKLVRSD